MKNMRTFASLCLLSVLLLIVSICIVDNGDDGTVSTLSSNEAKCTMFFAVHVTYQKMAVYGMNFDKAGITIYFFSL